MSVDAVAALLLLGGFFLLLILRIPVALSLALSSIATALFLNIRLTILIQNMFSSVDSFALLAVPFFIIAGELMGRGGISSRLVGFSRVLVGNLRGGLAYVNCITSTIFGGISGSAVADISSLGSILIPMMKAEGYDEDFSVGITLSTAVQSILIPPSHNMVIYAMVAGGVSVGRMFLGGIVPGLLLGACLLAYSAYTAYRRNYPAGIRVSFREGLRIVGNSLWGLGTVVIILTGVCTGICTVTEAAALAVVYACFVTFVIYREIPFEQIVGIFRDGFKTVANVMFLIAASGAFGWLLAYIRVPQLVSNAILGMTTNRFAVMLLLNLILLVLGMICDMGPIILIATPVLLPVAQAIGMNPIHFGVIMMLNLGIGLTTPPVGAALFAVCAIGKVSMGRAVRATVPMYLVMLFVLVLVNLLPDIVLFLPRLLMG
ncbi:MAG: TRAP transporter large permease [Clostridia bacterium]|nr:TRAP transporter large permease [Clostridia bacterium]